VRIVVIGIDTEVGKTVVSALLTLALKAHYWKPIQCGLPSDSAWIKSITEQPCYPDGLTLQTPCSPHFAAKKRGLSYCSQYAQTNSSIRQKVGFHSLSRLK
jgi:dethiobiotin synthetase